MNFFARHVLNPHSTGEDSFTLTSHPMLGLWTLLTLSSANISCWKGYRAEEEKETENVPGFEPPTHEAISTSLA